MNPRLLTREIKDEHLDFVVPSIADFAFATAQGLPLERHAVRQLDVGEVRGVLAISGQVRMINILETNDNSAPTSKCEKRPP